MTALSAGSIHRTASRGASRADSGTQQIVEGFRRGDSPQRRRGSRFADRECAMGRTFGGKEAWDATDHGSRDFGNLPEEVKSAVLSIALAGSLVRGDFIPDRSDVDLYTLYEAKAVDADIHERVRGCFDPHFAPYKGHSHNSVRLGRCLPDAGQPAPHARRGPPMSFQGIRHLLFRLRPTPSHAVGGGIHPFSSRARRPETPGARSARRSHPQGGPHLAE